MNLTAPPTMRFGAPFVPLAIEETALAREFTPRAMMYWDDAPAKPYRVEGDVAVVEIVGALDTRGGWWWDGYDLIAQRTAAALADPKVKAVVLALDSPGGMAAGNLDCAQQLRALADAAGKPLVAHAGTMACSAAYALACAADHVVLTTDGAVGSIGTIATVYDRTEANEKAGYDVRVVRSGPLKADPHPDVPLTDASVARVRARINELAATFAAWVSSRRPECRDPLSLQGAVVYGADSVSKGLADAVGTLADAVTTAASMAASTRKKMDHEKQLAAVLTALGATSHEEALALITTQKKAADALAQRETELAAVRAELAQRDATTATQARETVLAKHRSRGALTPAMEADSAYLADLAPLSAEALDRVLSKLPGAPQAATPKRPESVQPGADSEELTAEEIASAKKFGVSLESARASKKLDRERAQARGLAE